MFQNFAAASRKNAPSNRSLSSSTLSARSGNNRSINIGKVVPIGEKNNSQVSTPLKSVENSSNMSLPSVETMKGNSMVTNKVYSDKIGETFRDKPIGVLNDREGSKSPIKVPPKASDYINFNLNLAKEDVVNSPEVEAAFAKLAFARRSQTSGSQSLKPQPNDSLPLKSQPVDSLPLKSQTRESLPLKPQSGKTRISFGMQPPPDSSEFSFSRDSVTPPDISNPTAQFGQNIQPITSQLRSTPKKPDQPPLTKSGLRESYLDSLDKQGNIIKPAPLEKPSIISRVKNFFRRSSASPTPSSKTPSNQPQQTSSGFKIFPPSSFSSGLCSVKDEKPKSENLAGLSDSQSTGYSASQTDIRPLNDFVDEVNKLMPKLKGLNSTIPNLSNRQTSNPNHSNLAKLFLCQVEVMRLSHLRQIEGGLINQLPLKTNQNSENLKSEIKATPLSPYRTSNQPYPSNISPYINNPQSYKQDNFDVPPYTFNKLAVQDPIQKPMSSVQEALLQHVNAPSFAPSQGFPDNLAYDYSQNDPRNSYKNSSTVSTQIPSKISSQQYPQDPSLISYQNPTHIFSQVPSQSTSKGSIQIPSENSSENSSLKSLSSHTPSQISFQAPSQAFSQTSPSFPSPVSFQKISQTQSQKAPQSPIQSFEKNSLRYEPVAQSPSPFSPSQNKSSQEAERSAKNSYTMPTISPSLARSVSPMAKRAQLKADIARAQSQLNQLYGDNARLKHELGFLRDVLTPSGASPVFKNILLDAPSSKSVSSEIDKDTTAQLQERLMVVEDEIREQRRLAEETSQLFLQEKKNLEEQAKETINAKIEAEKLKLATEAERFAEKVKADAIRDKNEILLKANDLTDEKIKLAEEKNRLAEERNRFIEEQRRLEAEQNRLALQKNQFDQQKDQLADERYRLAENKLKLIEIEEKRISEQRKEIERQKEEFEKQLASKFQPPEASKNSYNGSTSPFPVEPPLKNFSIPNNNSQNVETFEDSPFTNSTRNPKIENEPRRKSLTSNTFDSPTPSLIPTYFPSFTPFEKEDSSISTATPLLSIPNDEPLDSRLNEPQSSQNKDLKKKLTFAQENKKSTTIPEIKKDSIGLSPVSPFIQNDTDTTESTTSQPNEDNPNPNESGMLIRLNQLPSFIEATESNINAPKITIDAKETKNNQESSKSPLIIRSPSPLRKVVINYTPLEQNDMLMSGPFSPKVTTFIGTESIELANFLKDSQK